MGYIPDDAEWYLAEIVEENQVEGEQDNVVYVNFILVHAQSPEDAYEKAIELGHEAEMSYENMDGKQVTVTFRGLRDLNVIHDKLEHGAELIYERKAGLTQQALESLVVSKDQLGIFRPRKPVTRPNLAPKDVMEKLDAYLAGLAPTSDTTGATEPPPPAPDDGEDKTR